MSINNIDSMYKRPKGWKQWCLLSSWVFCLMFLGYLISSLVDYLHNPSTFTNKTYFIRIDSADGWRFREIETDNYKIFEDGKCISTTIDKKEIISCGGAFYIEDITAGYDEEVFEQWRMKIDEDEFGEEK